MAKNKKKFKENKDEQKLVSYDVIVAASHGNQDALSAILKHYEKYISELALIKVFDDYGNSKWIVDEDIRCEIELRLIIKILAFKIAKL